MNKRKVMVIGAVGTTRNIIEQLIDARDNFAYPIGTVGVLIDSYPVGTSISGAEVLGSTSEIQAYLKERDTYFIFSLHKPELLNERLNLLKSYLIPAEKFLTFIHPNSYISNTSSIGNGTIVLSNTTIQSGVRLGDYNIINSGITIEHDTKVGDFNFFAANSCLGSGIEIGNCNFVGLNSSIREGIKIGNNVFVGMHSLVINNYSDCKVAGVPAKILKNK